MDRTITIARRFRGPPESVNGGYAAGVVSEGIDGVVVATLRMPPPMDTSMTLISNGTENRLMHGDDLIAEAAAATLELTVPDPPSLDEAVAASHRFVTEEEHIFPGCFVCGPSRERGDGLCIFPGPVAGSDVVAAPWIPDTSIGREGEPLDRRYVWSALDCPSYFALGTMPRAVLGQLTAAIERLPVVGEELIAMGWPLGVEGRKHSSGSALATPEGEIIARAAALWIELKPD